MQQSLYRKWRPQTFDALKGQAVIRDTIVYALTNNRMSQAYLFCGPRGTGKTTTARLIAKFINCSAEGDRPCNTCASCLSITDGSNFDILEVDAASNRGIDEIRQLRESVRFAPTQAAYKVYIIDEVHMLTREAFNALLKTLEEPPKHTLFILATTEAHKIPATIISRCQRYDFRLPDVTTLADHLVYVAKEEGVTVTPEGAQLLARLADGSFRDSLSLLEQVISLGQPAYDVPDIDAIFGYVPQEKIELLLAAVLQGKLAEAHSALDEIITQGGDLRALCDRMLLVSQDCLEALILGELTPSPLGKSVKAAGLKRLVLWIERLLDVANQIKVSPIPRLPLDVAITAFAEDSQAVPVTTPVVSPVASAPVAPKVTAVKEVTTTSKVETVVTVIPESEPTPDVAVHETVSVPVAVALPQVIESEEWQKVLDALKVETPSLVTSLSHAKVMGMEVDILKIAVKYKMHADKINQVKNRAVIESVIQNVMSAPLKIEAYVVKDLPMDDDDDTDDLASVFDLED